MKLTRAPYRLEARPGGYTVIIPRPCNDCDASGIVAKTSRHYPTTYDNCPTCKGTGSTEARFLLSPHSNVSDCVMIIGTTGPCFMDPYAAAEHLVASFARPWNHEPAPRPTEDIIAAVTSFESPV